MNRALSPGRMMLMTTLVGRHLRDAGLEHRARFVASSDSTGDDRINIVEVEGGVPASIRVRGARFGVVWYHHDVDGAVGAVEDRGWFDTLALAAACVVEMLRPEAV